MSLGIYISGSYWVIPEYNHLRPRNSLNGLTPYEAYTGKQIDIAVQIEKIKQAKQLRVIENPKNLCCIFK